MTTDRFAEIWADWRLRQYLVDACKACTRCIELQEDCLQEAAIGVMREDGDKTIEHYAEVGRRAINACQMREVRYRQKKKRLLKFAAYMRRGRQA